MIKFKNLTLQNFLSVGDNPIEVQLARSPTTIIMGGNGHGKSCIIDGLTFALFGKPYRNINKDGLINSVNQKKCQVTIDFDIGKDSYQIIRGIKPNKFEITKNGDKLDDAASVKEQQRMLENQILKTDMKTFCQVVIIGSASYVPFMLLSAPQRREVVEALLDIQVFSSMNKKLKQRASTASQKYDDLEHRLEKVQVQIDMGEQSFADTLKFHEKIIGDIKSQIKELVAKTKGAIESREAFEHDLKEIEYDPEEHASLKEECEGVFKEREELDDRIRRTKMQLESLEKIEPHSAEFIEEHEARKRGRADLEAQLEVIGSPATHRAERQRVETDRDRQKAGIARCDDSIKRLANEAKKLLTMDDCPTCGQKMSKEHAKKESLNLKQQINELTEAKKQFESDLADCETDIADLQAKIDRHRELDQQVLTLRTRTEADERAICEREDQIKSLSDKDPDALRKDLEFDQALLKEKDGQISFMDTKLKDHERMKDAVRDLKVRIDRQNEVIDQAKDESKALQAKLEKAETDKAEDEQSRKIDAEEMTQQKAETEKQLKALSKEREVNSVCLKLLKDDGIKASIVAQYIPVINAEVNRFLSTLNFNIQFEMDEEFRETLKSRYRNEFTYHNLSQGEKMRLDLAILFAWREVAKMKGSVNTNLLFLDETFDSSLDADGINDLFMIFSEFQNRTNIFVISHREGLEDHFRSHIRIEKHNGFTRMV